ncbi:unnamed protein product [Parajaminaea phylloscopi]
MLPFDLLPSASPLRDPLIKYAFCASLLVQHGLFHGLSNTFLLGEEPAQLKKRAWILTTFNGLVTSLAALPFLWDLFSSGFDLHAIEFRRPFTHSICAFFVAYLLSDLGLGSIYYRKLINVSSGWIHHSVYTLLFTFWVHKGWDHIVVAACIFELPTFVMGIACIHPPLRSNMAFTTSFFVTRVFLHIALLCSAATQHGRAAPGIDGSYGPLLSMAVTLPMHLWWGYKCILSVRRRMHKRKLAARAEREKDGNALANVAGQAFNGFGAPDMHSAVNTPLPTPGLNSGGATLVSSNFAQSAPVAIHAAFAKAAAASKRPMELVLNRPSKRKNSASSASSKVGVIVTSTDDVNLAEDESGRSSTDFSLLQVPASVGGGVRPSYRGGSSRSSFDGTSRRSSSEMTRVSSHPLTVPVPPEGAGPDAREPFLAIRSAAEGQDRARRLIADAVRKIWFGAPESWRRQFEEDAAVMDAMRQRHPRRAARSLADPSDTEVDDTDGHDEDDQDDGHSAELAKARMRSRTRAQRARAALRRGVLRAVRRAINGREGLAFPASGLEHERRSREQAEMIAAAQSDAVARSLGKEGTAVDLGQVLKLSGLPFPPEWTGEEYVVRPLEVERRREGQTARARLVGDVRRKMEVRARDVVVWD